jgi:1-acyl-sn-glycerol-3-phosphate acyltransferase
MTTPPRKRKRSDAPGPEAPSPKRPRRRRSTPPSSAPSPETPLAEPSDASAMARMKAIEERLDRMIDARARERDSSVPSKERDASASTQRAASASTDLVSRAPATAHLEAPWREHYSGDFRPGDEARTPGHGAAADEVDDFGYDPAYERKVLPFLELLYDKYFRVEPHGIGHVPAEGRCLLVANHSGTLPLDGLMLRLAVRREHPRHRGVRWLAEDGIFHFPFLGNMTNRVGAVRACQENAERLLENESLVAVFPEGQKGVGKLFRDRYRLQRFGRGGFVKLCLRTRTPIVPVAIVGGEETTPVLARVEYLTRALGIPYVPVTPTFPLLGPAGLLPAPTKWKIFFGEPIDLEEYAPASADDEILVGRLTERVRGAIQTMLDRAVAERRSVWFG